MKHLAARILLFLLLGAVINVAVAWACAARSESLRYDGTDYRPAMAADLPTYLLQWWPPPVRFGEAKGQGFGVSQTEVVCTDIAPDQFSEGLYEWNKGPLRAMHTRLRFGWPLRSMYYDQPGLQGELSKAAKLEFFARCEKEAGLRFWAAFPRWVPVASGSRQGVPRAVLPLGFAVNSAFYGAVLVPAWVVPAFCRRWIRRRRSLCPHCAYPIGTSPVCTECGHPLPAAERRKSVAQGASPG